MTKDLKYYTQTELAYTDPHTWVQSFLAQEADGFIGPSAKFHGAIPLNLLTPMLTQYVSAKVGGALEIHKQKPEPIKALIDLIGLALEKHDDPAYYGTIEAEQEQNAIFTLAETFVKLDDDFDIKATTTESYRHLMKQLQEKIN